MASLNKKIRLHHITDTHSRHNLLEIPSNIDLIIHSGDCSNYREPYRNEQEIRDFITWYSSLNIKYKIFCAGNHDTSIEAGYLTKDNFTQAGIIYLENESVNIEGLSIWGSPFTPSFGLGWAYNKKREKLFDLWQTIPNNTDIVITHGPPKGILDLSENRERQLEYCGCNALKNRLRILKPILSLFGHIHQNEENYNDAILYRNGTYYSNASSMRDGENFGLKIVCHGHTFEIDIDKSIKII